MRAPTQYGNIYTVARETALVRAVGVLGNPHRAASTRALRMARPPPRPPPPLRLTPPRRGHMRRQTSAVCLDPSRPSPPVTRPSRVLCRGEVLSNGGWNHARASCGPGRARPASRTPEPARVAAARARQGSGCRDVGAALRLALLGGEQLTRGLPPPGRLGAPEGGGTRRGW